MINNTNGDNGILTVFFLITKFLSQIKIVYYGSKIWVRGTLYKVMGTQAQGCPLDTFFRPIPILFHGDCDRSIPSHGVPRDDHMTSYLVRILAHTVIIWFVYRSLIAALPYCISLKLNYKKLIWKILSSHFQNLTAWGNFKYIT